MMTQGMKIAVSGIALVMAITVCEPVEAQVSQMMRPSELGGSGRTGVSQQRVPTTAQQVMNKKPETNKSVSDSGSGSSAASANSANQNGSSGILDTTKGSGGVLDLNQTTNNPLLDKLQEQGNAGTTQSGTSGSGSAQSGSGTGTAGSAPSSTGVGPTKDAAGSSFESPFAVFDRASISDNDIGKTEAKENKVEQKETPTESKKENVNSSQVPDNETVTILKMINSDKNSDSVYDEEGAAFFFKGADTVTVAIPKGDKSPEAEAYRKSLEAAYDEDLSDLAFYDIKNMEGIKRWTKSRLSNAEKGYKKAQDQLTEMDKDKERLEELKKKQAEAKENGNSVDYLKYRDEIESLQKKVDEQEANRSEIEAQKKKYEAKKEMYEERLKLADDPAAFEQAQKEAQAEYERRQKQMENAVYAYAQKNPDKFMKLSEYYDKKNELERMARKRKNELERMARKRYQAVDNEKTSMAGKWHQAVDNDYGERASQRLGDMGIVVKTGSGSGKRQVEGKFK